MISTLPSFHTPTQEYLFNGTNKERIRSTQINTYTIPFYELETDSETLRFFITEDMKKSIHRKEVGSWRKRGHVAELNNTVQFYASSFSFYCCAWNSRSSIVLRKDDS